jgi:hypothetical protein
VANQYLDTTYVDAYLGASVRAALFTDEGGAYSSTNFNTVAKAATSLVETALRNSGYTVPSATVSTCSTVAEYVRLAAFGAFVDLAYNRAEKRLKIPQDWNTHPAKTAYRAIIDGDANLDLTLSVVGAIGGFTFSITDDDTSSSDGGRHHTFSRKNMSGY